MPVPNAMSDLSQLPGSNYPVGSEAIGNNLDNYLRAQAALIKQSNSIASSTMPSGSTVNVALADAESVTITGDAAISSLGTGFNGCKRELRFTGVATLTHSSALQLPGGANITTSAGQTHTFRCIGANSWVLVASSPIPVGFLPQWSGINPSSMQGALGYTPVQQGGGDGMGTNKVHVGWGDSKLRAQVDLTPLGNIALESWVTSGFAPKNNPQFTGLLRAGNIAVGEIQPADQTKGITIAWNVGGAGETDFVNQRQLGPGGFNWYNRSSFNDPVGPLLLSLDSSGNLTANGNVTGFSDLRLKTNVRPIKSALSLVRRLQGIRYVKDGCESIGFGAQDFGEVLPELRHIAKDEMGTQSVAYGNVTAVHNEAIKELANRLDLAGI